MKPSTPSVTVVTAVLNGARTIGDCLASVAGQSQAVEHVVADGGSTDKTVDVISVRGDGSVRVLPGPDRGIYDGMNRGIAAATGEIVGTLNADDVYADGRVIEDVVAAFANPEADCVYGDLEYVAAKDLGKVVRRWRAGEYTPSRMYQGWMPPHPTFFVRRRFYQEFGAFNLALGTAADYELMLRFLLKHGLKPAYIPRVLVRMRAGGASNRSPAARLRANRMDREAWRVNGLRPRPWTLVMKPLRKIGQFVTCWRSDQC